MTLSAIKASTPVLLKDQILGSYLAARVDALSDDPKLKNADQKLKIGFRYSPKHVTPQLNYAEFKYKKIKI